MDLKSFAQAIRELAEEKGVAESKVIETIELAIAAAYKKDYGKRGQIIKSRFNPETGELRFSQIKIVVDESMIKSEEEIEAEEALHGNIPDDEAPVKPAAAKATGEGGEESLFHGETGEARKVRFNPERHIMIDEARQMKPDAKPGEELEFPLEPKSDFGRIASQTAKQVIIQRIREAERDATYGEYKIKEGEIVSGIVQRIEGRNVFVDLGRGVALLPAEEQIPRERVALGERIKALLVLVEKDARGPGMILSRSHPRFLKKLFGLEVPEIAAGNVEIKVMAREAGSRSKIAVASNDPAIDPVGSMVGQRGVRVSTVMNEIRGEKIDIIEWSDNPSRFISNALSPAKIVSVELDADRREAAVIAPEDQLSLAIGKGGQNVRLAAKLTGWRIDVRSAESGAKAETTEAENEIGAAGAAEASEEIMADEAAGAAAEKSESEKEDNAVEETAAEKEGQPQSKSTEEKPAKKTGKTKK